MLHWTWEHSCTQDKVSRVGGGTGCRNFCFACASAISHIHARRAKAKTHAKTRQLGSTVLIVNVAKLCIPKKVAWSETDGHLACCGRRLLSSRALRAEDRSAARSYVDSERGGAFFFAVHTDRIRTDHEHVLSLHCVCVCDTVYDNRHRYVSTTHGHGSWPALCARRAAFPFDADRVFSARKC